MAKKIVPDQPLNGTMKEIFGAKHLENIADDIFEYYLSIPRPYIVYIPISLFENNHFKSIDLTKNISIESFKKDEDLPFPIETIFGKNYKSDADKTFLKLKAEGFCINKLENPTIKKCFSYYKQFIQQGLSTDVLALKNLNEQNIANFLRFTTNHNLPRLSVVSIDELKPESIKSTELPLEICRFIQRLDFNWGDINKESSYTIENVISNRLRKVSLLYLTDAFGSQNIKAAMEWFFDCLTHENKTISFILLCIGLESLFESNEKSITELLAERYSLVVSRTIEDRANLKTNLKLLYKLRSKFVHGNKQFLSEDDYIHYKRGKLVLEYAIDSELNRLVLSSDDSN